MLPGSAVLPVTVSLGVEGGRLGWVAAASPRPLGPGQLKSTPAAWTPMELAVKGETGQRPVQAGGGAGAASKCPFGRCLLETQN